MHEVRLKVLQRLAIAEGFSLLALVTVAMPMKYALGIPEAVRYMGWVHGGLFTVFALVLGWAFLTRSLGFFSSGLVLASAFVPGGHFWADRYLQKRMENYQV